MKFVQAGVSPLSLSPTILPACLPYKIDIVENRCGFKSYSFLYCSISLEACNRDVGSTVQPRLRKKATCIQKQGIYK